MHKFINPFEIYSEKKLFWLGVVLAFLASLLSSYSNLLIFGSLKVINNYHQTWYIAIFNLTLILVSNSVVLFVFGRLRYNKTRFIDVFNVVLIAHIAIYVLLFLTALPVVQNALTAIELEILDKGFVAPELSKLHMFTIGIFGILTLSLIVYFFYLLVVGMKIAMNSKNKVDVFVIIVLVFTWNTLIQFLNPFI